MRTRKLGNSDMELTVVGLGAWAIGGAGQVGWGKQDDEDSFDAIYEAMDVGINWIDTAPMYGQGRSEEVVGRALKGMGERPFVMTKCGLVWDDENQRIPSLEPDSIRRECEDSLRRLDVEVIDLYQIHWPIDDDKAIEAWAVIAELIGQGKVRYGGVSNFSVEQIKACQKIFPVTSLQPHYSMIVRDIEEEILGCCKENNVGVIPYSPMGRGLLTGKFTAERLASLEDGDHRQRSELFKEPGFSRTLEFVEKMRPIAYRNGITLPQLAVSWVIAHDGITAAIVGARRKGQISETVKASDVVLPDEDMEEIERSLKDFDL